MGSSTAEPIAIIGMGCRFPGADNPAAFWQLLRDGVDAITGVPPERFDIDVYYDPDGKPGTISTRWGGFIPGVDLFDADFFGIAPREVEAMDPQQRILLEVAWEALEDAGLAAQRLVGSPTGVFVGISHTDYAQLSASAGVPPSLYSSVGTAHSIAANRLSYVLNLLGPSMAVDAACASSLTAVHLACRSLRQEECELALVAGVNVILDPQTTIAYSQAQMLSPDGRCKTFDAAADGYVRSDGCGVVVLKPLASAVRDGDPIVALIRGSASNQDGRTSGITVPNCRAQEAVVRAALRDAGLEPSDIDYVEAHGTGTLVGDPIEFAALQSVFAGGEAQSPCFIGSGKTNIGHAESASGIAGLIRTALILRHREVPPHLHLKQLNPAIDLLDSRIRIATERQSLGTEGRPLHAGVNSFGFGGSNCHVILEEAPPQAGEPRSTGPQLLTLSAKTPEALIASAAAFQTRLAGGEVDLPNLCYTANARRTHHRERLALVAGSPQEFCDHLDAFPAGELNRGMARGSASGDHRIVFVCSGMGSQWIGMAQSLLDYPVFRAAIERCDAALPPWVDWSLLAELGAEKTHARWDDIGVLQPALFAISVALADLWRSWGIEPDAVVGHSVGEVAAAYLAGVLSLEDAVHLVCRRGDVLRQASGQGAMLSVDLPAEEVAPFLDERVSIGVINSPRSTVLSGEPAAIDDIARLLAGRGISARRVKSDIAFHSPQMDALRDPFVSSLRALMPGTEKMRIYSTVTGTQLHGEAFDAAHWGRNLRRPVAFVRAVERLYADGYDTFLELSPHPVLLQSIRDNAGPEAVALPSLRREKEWETLLESLGALHAAGADVRWEGLYPEGGRCVPLPSYPWQRERFWFKERSRGRKRPESGHPLLGVPVQSAAHGNKRVWEIDLDLESFPFLADHRVGSSVLFPAAAYVEIGLAVARAVGLSDFNLEDFAFIQGMVLPTDSAKTLQVVASLDVPGRVSLEFFSREPGESAAWNLHATGTARRTGDHTPRIMSPERFQAAHVWSRPEVYRHFEQLTLGFGPAFQSVECIAWRNTESMGQLRVPEPIEGELPAYHLHPVLLDACLQVFLPCETPDLYLPAAIRQLHVYDVSREGLWTHVVRRHEDGETIEGDIYLYNAANDLVLEAKGYQVRRREAVNRSDDWLYRPEWEAIDLPQRQPWACHWLLLSHGDETGARLAALLDAHGLPYTLCTHQPGFAQLGPRQYGLELTSKEDFDRLLTEVVPDGVPVGFVDLRALDELAPSAGSGHCVSLTRLVQSWASSGIPARLWVVTRGAQAVDGMTKAGLAQSPILGFARSLANEHPELQCKRIDLDPTSPAEEVQDLAAELLGDDAESEVAWRSGIRYGYRLARYSPADRFRECSPIRGDEPFRLTIEEPGILDHLVLRRVARPHPGPGEIEIRVRAAGLNFRDVMSAMGTLPGYPNGLGPLGYECSGIVSAVGQGVENFREGDEVVANTYHSFASYAIADAHLVVPKPARLSFAEAATIPVTFLTATYALQHLARLQPGERVLIHAGAGGVGMAAIQIAQSIGAEVFATAGSPRKREFLRSIGVPHVMDSRSLEFATEVMALTDGEGVDVVLNSLAGPFIAQSLSVLRPYGRFLELGRKDIYANNSLGLQPFRRNLAFFGIDLDLLCHDRSAFAGELLRDIMEAVEEGKLRPLPYTVYPISDAAEAFRTMAGARHIGKIVISLEEDRVPVRAEVSCRSDATYLVTGGLGGLGLVVARWLVEQGARSLVLVGRRGITSESGPVVAELRARGCEVTVAQVDVAREEQIVALLAEMEALPPLRGIIHAAGVMDDGIVLHLNEERFKRVMAPKIAGAWNLHARTLDRPLDFFVLFSSAAGLLGGPGQSNYAAANQFLDTLAHYRQALGLPALSIAWGPWAEVGMAARLGDRLAARALQHISLRRGTETLGRIMVQPVAHLGVIPMDWQERFEAEPQSASAPFYSRLIAEVIETPVHAEMGPLQMLANAPEEERPERLEVYLRDQVARVMGIAGPKIRSDSPLISLGLDSLMGVELRNRIHSALGIEIPTQIFLDGAGIVDLARLLLDRLAASLPAAPEIEEIML